MPKFPNFTTKIKTLSCPPPPFPKHWYKPTPPPKAIIEDDYQLDREEIEHYIKIQKDQEKFNSY